MLSKKEDREFQLEMLRTRVYCEEITVVFTVLLAIEITVFVFIAHLTSTGIISLISGFAETLVLVFLILFTALTYFLLRGRAERKFEKIRKKFIDYL